MRLIGGQPGPLPAPRECLAARADFFGAEILGTDFIGEEFSRKELRTRKMLRASFPNREQQSKAAEIQAREAVET